MPDGSLSQAEVGALLSQDEDTNAAPTAAPDALDFTASPKVEGPAQYAEIAAGIRDTMALAANSRYRFTREKTFSFLILFLQECPKQRY